MKNLLNLGVSDPLTLGMAHPVADRLEILGRARPTTWRSRGLALSAMSLIAIATAPLSIASDHPEPETEKEVKSHFKFISNMDGKRAQSYEIIEEDGSKKAYRILEGGERKEVPFTKKSDGTYQLTYDDGQVVDIPNIDGETFETLRGLKGLAGLSKLEGLKSLRSLEALKGLENLDGLKSLEDLKNFEGIEFSGKDIEIFTLDGDKIKLSENANLWDSFPEKIRDMLTSKDGSKRNKIVHTGDSYRWIEYEGDIPDSLDLPDTIVDLNVDFLRSSDPIESAQRQLDIAKRQLQSLAKDDNISFDLKNALRDIENAQKSLLEAESRMIDDDE